MCGHGQFHARTGVYSWPNCTPPFPSPPLPLPSPPLPSPPLSFPPFPSPPLSSPPLPFTAVLNPPGGDVAASLHQGGAPGARHRRHSRHGAHRDGWSLCKEEWGRRRKAIYSRVHHVFQYQLLNNLLHFALLQNTCNNNTLVLNTCTYRCIIHVHVHVHVHALNIKATVQVSLKSTQINM